MKRIALLAATLVAATLAGCTATPAPVDDRIQVVASTNVYGDIAKAIGGDLVTVTSLIGAANQDPHSFEASALDQLAVSKADLVIVNGGGYDDFMERLLTAADSKPIVLNAYNDYNAIIDAAGPINEHLWYSLSVTKRTAGGIAYQLGQIDATNSRTYQANASKLWVELDRLLTRAGKIGRDGTETGPEYLRFGERESVAMTELVPEYLLFESNLDNITPPEFTEAIEEGSDVPPLALKQTLAVLTEKEVVLLAYNEQTASPETERLRQAADDAGIPVLNFTETLPEGETYVSWMTANVKQIEAALK